MKTTHPPVIMACCHYGVAFACNVSTFENLVDVHMFWIDFSHLWIVCYLKLVEHLVACSFDFICA